MIKNLIEFIFVLLFYACVNIMIELFGEYFDYFVLLLKIEEADVMVFHFY